MKRVKLFALISLLFIGLGHAWGEITAYTAGDVGNYVIATLSNGKYYALPNNPTVNSGKITGVEITTETTADNVVYVSASNAVGYTWTIANATNGQTISDGSKYIYHSNGGSSGTNLAYGTSTSYTWVIEKENTGLTFKAMSGTTTNTRGMLCNGTTFGGYALSNEDASGYNRIVVLPIGSSSGVTYTDYLTECPSVDKDEYTISWNVNGSEFASTKVTEGKAVVLPETKPASCSDTYTHFVGWFTEAAGNDSNPSSTIPGTQVTAATVPDGNATYYAVFSDAQLSEELALATTLTDGDNIYLATTSGTGISGANSNNKDATVSTDKAAWMPFTVTNYADGTFQLKNGTNYVNCAASVFTLAATGTSLTLNEKGYFTFTSGTDTYCLMQNYNNGTYYYRCYKTTNTSTAYTQFFMYKAGTPATGYISFCCTDAAVVTITPASNTVNIGADGNATTTVSCSQKGGGIGTWTYSVSPSDGATFDGTTFTATQEGTYTLTATYTETCGKSGRATITVTKNPVFETPTIDNSTFSVNYPDTTSMASAATISIDAAYNLTQAITVTASDGFLISTNKGDKTKYSNTLTLTPTASGENKGKLQYTNVYVRAYATAKENKTVNGTITFKSSEFDTQTVDVQVTITVPTYTVTWSVNGTTTPKEYKAGDALTLPEGFAPTTSDCDSRKQFVGWTNQEISDGEKPAVLFTTPNGTVTSDSTFYAVFATANSSGENGSVELTSEEITSSFTTSAAMNYGTEYSYTKEGITWTASGYKDNIARPWIQLKAANDAYIKISSTYAIKNIAVSITSATNSSGGIADITMHTDYGSGVYLTEKAIASPATSPIASTTTITNDVASIDITDKEVKELYVQVDKGARIWGMTITYSGLTTYSDYVTTCCTPLETPTGMRNTQTHDGGVIRWNAVNNASGYEVKIDGGEWTSAGNSTSYTITGKAAGGTLVTWQVRAVGTTPYCDMSDPCEVQTFKTNCTQYTFAYGSEANGDGNNINDAVYECFTQVGGGTEWEIRDFVIPNTAQYYWVGYNGYFYNDGLGSSNASSQRNQFKYLPVTNLQRSSCSGTGDWYNHAMEGAYGRLRIYSNYGDKNLFVAFEPAGYQLRVGVGEGEAWETWALHQNATSPTIWTSDTITVDKTLNAKHIYVSLWETAAFDANKAGVAINNWTNGDGQIQSLSSKKNDQWQFNSGVSTGATGFFRMYSDNCANNGYLHFVPLHRITYTANYPEGVSGEPADTYSAYVSVEENKSFTNPAAPAAPSGYRFAGWYTEATGGTKIETEYTIPVGATADVTLYAQWNKLYTVSYNANSGSYSESCAGDTYVTGETHSICTTIPTRATYTFLGYATSADGDVAYTYSDGGFTPAEVTIADANVTLYAKWALNTYTVNWYVDGRLEKTDVYNHGTALTLPTSTPSGCGEKVFVGWTANSAYDDATIAPSDLFTVSSGTVTANMTYYAVFAKKVTVDTQVKSKTLEITISNFTEITTSYTTTFTHAYADDNTSVEAYGVYKSNNGIQMNSGKSTYIKNTIALAAPITNITCNWSSSGKNSPTLYVASDNVASKSSDNLGKQSNSVTTQSVDVNPDRNYRYFYFDGTTVSGACYLTSLQITYGGSYSTYSEYTTSCSGRASMPVFSPASGATIQSGEKVVITCSTEGAAIRYTLDGSEPTAESALYTGDGVRISVQEAGSVTLKAIAIADGMGTSYVATATYSVTLPAPTGVVLHANNDTDDYAAVSVAYGSSEPVCYFPTYADSIFLGFYTSAIKGEGSKLYAADGTMVLNVEGYTDAYGWASLDSRIDLYAQWMKPEAIVVDENTTNLDKYPYDLSKMDIIIQCTGSLTLTKDVTVHDVHVQSGGTLAIEQGSLQVNSLHLYSGWQDGKKNYGVPSVYIAPEASLSKTVQTVYLDLCIDNDHFYPLAVPFPVKICGTSESEANMQGYHVRYAEDWLNQYAKYRADGTGQVIIKRYDGAHRAETGKAEGNWVGVAYNETLQPSEGYIIRAVPVNGQDTAVIRIEMEVPDAWTTGGEQGTVEKITRNQINVTAHGTDKPALDDTHKGWNMLGVPYLSYFGTQNWDGESSGIAGGKVVIQDGKIVLDDKTVRYVSVPTYDFSEYIQTPLSSTSLRPGWSFFVQIGKSGTLTFATTDREASSPLLAPAQSHSEQELTLLLNHGAKSDHTGLILSDAYTTDYEIGADLEKMFGEGFTLSVYTLSGNTRLAYNALSREAATQLIPVGFRAPEDGEYTFSLPDESPTEGIERIDLIDYETGYLTNLPSAPYTFSTTRTESESRFAITITYSKETPTDTEAPFGKGNKRIEKVLIQQQLYIIIDGKMYDATGKKVNE